MEEPVPGTWHIASSTSRSQACAPELCRTPVPPWRPLELVWVPHFQQSPANLPSAVPHFLVSASHPSPTPTPPLGPPPGPSPGSGVWAAPLPTRRSTPIAPTARSSPQYKFGAWPTLLPPPGAQPPPEPGTGKRRRGPGLRGGPGPRGREEGGRDRPEEAGRRAGGRGCRPPAHERPWRGRAPGPSSKLGGCRPPKAQPRLESSLGSLAKG